MLEIYNKFKSWFNRITVRCFQCGKAFKADKGLVTQFLDIQKVKGIEAALDSIQIKCPKCQNPRWTVESVSKKVFQLKFKKPDFKPFLMAIADILLWTLAWLEYRRQVLVRNWWFDYKSVVCRGGALISLLIVIYFVKIKMNVEFYQAALAVAVLYGIMKFSKN